jgi:glycosyltransferase involved in cell wall biosynthesis
MPELITVIVPCFNYGHYLPQCIGSLQAQSHQQWECIIVDDGSTDSTPDACRRLALADSRVTFIRQPNAGLSAARNAGVRLAKGDAVQLLDADDILEPDKFAVQMRYLAENPEQDIVVGRALFFEGAVADRLTTLGYGPGSTNLVPGKQRSTDVLAALVRDNICAVNAPLVRRSVFERVGLFDESLRAHEDWDFWVRCALDGRRFAVHTERNDRALVRQHDRNMSSSTETMLKTGILVRERLAFQLPGGLKEENRERLSEWKCILGVELIGAGRLAEGCALCWQGLQLSGDKPRRLSQLLSLAPGVSNVARLARKLRA